MGAPQNVFRFLRLLALDDWGLKLFCLAAAVFFWLYVDDNLTAEREVTTTLAAAGVRAPAELLLSEKSRRLSFRLKVHGPKDGRPGRIRALFDLSNFRAGRHTITAGPNKWRVDGFRVLRVEPETFSVELAAASERALPVRVRPRGEVREGFLLGEPTAVPGEVSVRGPREELAAATAVWTVPLDVSGRSEDFRTEARLEPFVVVAGRKVPIRCDEKVVVYFSIRPKPVSNVLRDLKIWGLAPPGTTLSIKPESLTVNITGRREAVAKAVAEPAKAIRLFVEWPADWNEPRGKPVFQELPVQVFAPELTVTAEDGGELPKVTVTAVFVSEDKRAKPPAAPVTVPPVPPAVPAAERNPAK